MFEKQALISLYAVSPIHVGSGTALGLIDNPIQREKHTNHPCIAGSSLKGAVRHQFQPVEKIAELFGPEVDKNQEAHMGAISFGDAQLLVFPVRSLKNGFVYITSPTALARAIRLLKLMQYPINWSIPKPPEGKAVINNRQLLNDDQRLQLEAFEYEVKKINLDWAKDFSQLFLPQHEALQFFSEKLEQDLVVLNDTDFNYFVEYSTSVEPHVHIDPTTGTAKSTGLFYTENLPPESILIAPVLFSRSRLPDSDLDAEQVRTIFKDFIHGRLLQVGGDATSGRGLLFSHFIAGA